MGAQQRMVPIGQGVRQSLVMSNSHIVPGGGGAMMQRLPAGQPLQGGQKIQGNLPSQHLWPAGAVQQATMVSMDAQMAQQPSIHVGGQYTTPQSHVRPQQTLNQGVMQTVQNLAGVQVATSGVMQVPRSSALGTGVSSNPVVMPAGGGHPQVVPNQRTYLAGSLTQQPLSQYQVSSVPTQRSPGYVKQGRMGPMTDPPAQRVSPGVVLQSQRLGGQPGVLQIPGSGQQMGVQGMQTNHRHHGFSHNQPIGVMQQPQASAQQARIDLVGGLGVQGVGMAGQGTAGSALWGFTQEQLTVLRQQILAFRRIRVSQT